VYPQPGCTPDYSWSTASESVTRHAPVTVGGRTSGERAAATTRELAIAAGILTHGTAAKAAHERKEAPLPHGLRSRTMLGSADQVLANKPGLEA
jgi:hypothetical protein